MKCVVGGVPGRSLATADAKTQRLHGCYLPAEYLDSLAVCPIHRMCI
jgi:hypothetical protein